MGRRLLASFWSAWGPLLRGGSLCPSRVTSVRAGLRGPRHPRLRSALLHGALPRGSLALRSLCPSAVQRPRGWESCLNWKSVIYDMWPWVYTPDCPSRTFHLLVLL